jgi:hypothetical protein
MLELPTDFNEYGSEVETKGWFGGAHLSMAGKTYKLIVYDPVRLAQEIDASLHRGQIFFEPNLVVVKSVTREAMEQAAEQLLSAVQRDELVEVHHG